MAEQIDAAPFNSHATPVSAEPQQCSSHLCRRLARPRYSMPLLPVAMIIIAVAAILCEEHLLCQAVQLISGAMQAGALPCQRLASLRFSLAAQCLCCSNRHGASPLPCISLPLRRRAALVYAIPKRCTSSLCLRLAGLCLRSSSQVFALPSPRPVARVRAVPSLCTTIPCFSFAAACVSFP